MDEFDQDYDFPLDDLEGFDFGELLTGVTNLSNQDYNLNSPLLPDDTEAFLQLMNNRVSPPKRFRSRYWDLWAANMLNLSPDVSGVTNIKTSINLMGHIALDIDIDTTEIETILDEANEDTEQTHSVLKAFSKGWLNRETTPGRKDNLPADILRVGQKHWDLHKMVLLMNAKTQAECSELTEVLGARITSWDDPSSSASGEFQTSSFGRVVVSGGFFYIPNFRLLGDRNFLLTLKDTFGARFFSSLSLWGRVDEKFPVDTVTMMFRLYSIGDAMLTRLGSEAYSLLKLVEPLALDRLSKVARLRRPLIPDFQDFTNHLDQCVQDGLAKDQGIFEIRALINEVSNYQKLLTIFGSFRHWGHPFINYFDGLEKLHKQTTMEKDIDDSYAQSLGSDLALMILSRQFNKTKTWSVNSERVPKNHPLRAHIVNGTWPTPGEIENFGDNWHHLPLIQCFDIPDQIDPAALYADKSHSIQLSELKDHLRNNPGRPIPTRKVLSTYLNTLATDWKSFLEILDRDGLTSDDLLIALREKERELKEAGRFFALMSWKLREYFVVTEYLIKKHYVPLFSGLTMADDLSRMMKKMLDMSPAHKSDLYSSVHILNHLDYEKWNNHQRMGATKYVFRVMGQFIGYPKLFERTHEFFERSLIYYLGRPDLMTLSPQDQVVNNSNRRVCWQGQAGGLEGLRQKGWSIVNLLIIKRESKIRETGLKVLAQGDNQVICTQYKLPEVRTQGETQEAIHNMVINNQVIMEAIKRGTEKLGLQINKDETLVSSEMMVYGKHVVLHGNFMGLDTKRFSRVSCVTNDQVPSLGNVMSTVSSTVLTVSHFSSSPLEPMRQHAFFGNLMRQMVEFHDPVLQTGLSRTLEGLTLAERVKYKILVLYLDPSLGGVCGTSLSRFLIRSFPDPITEGLSFWRLVYKNTSDLNLKTVASYIGNPELASFDISQLSKLIEDPTSLNLKRTLSVTYLLKQEIKRVMQKTSGRIINQQVRSVIEYSVENEDSLLLFLGSIQPLFPRFLSEFRSATYFGIVDGLTGLFQSSRTIRNHFRGLMSQTLNDVLIRSEVFGLRALLKISSLRGEGVLWDCSTAKADFLRSSSWGGQVLGATVPHPLEMIGETSILQEHCPKCREAGHLGDHVTTSVPLGLAKSNVIRGPLKIYNGSSTSESTSLTTPWEKKSDLPVLKKAGKLREAIHWFIEPGSQLAKSILGIMTGLTGEDFSSSLRGYKRTGSALHRFSCSRQSTGGYIAVSPIRTSYMTTTTDTLTCLGDKNYDFMFQSLILYAQITTGEVCKDSTSGVVVHHHIQCKSCLREIGEPILESTFVYLHPDMSAMIKGWIPDTTTMVKTISLKELPEGNWDRVPPSEGSHHIGRAIGFVFGDYTYSGEELIETTSLFPLTLQTKVEPDFFLDGFLDGLARAASLNILHKRGVGDLRLHPKLVEGSLRYLVEAVSSFAPALALLTAPRFTRLYLSLPHKTPPSYPSNNRDRGLLVKTYLDRLVSSRFIQASAIYKTPHPRIWIFSDLLTPTLTSLLIISDLGLKFMSGEYPIGGNKKNLLRRLKNEVQLIKQDNGTTTFAMKNSRAVSCKSEVRAAASKYKDSASPWDADDNLPSWVECEGGSITRFPVELIPGSDSVMKDFSCPRNSCPLMAGLRVVQVATGAHYKLRAIFSNMDIPYQGFLCGGDGSGGLTAFLLRWNPSSRGIFNSLLSYTGVDLRGSKPSPPAALLTTKTVGDRCVNLKDCWENPSDLTKGATWKYLRGLHSSEMVPPDLVVLDMEIQDPSSQQDIISNLIQYVEDILSPNGTVIFKSYLGELLNNPDNVINRLICWFGRVDVLQTSFSSSLTSEVYVVFQAKKQAKASAQKLNPQKFYGGALKALCFSDAAKEIGRCQHIKKLDMMFGCPIELLPDLREELVSILEFLGLPGGTAGDLGGYMMSNHKVFLEAVVATVFCVSNHILSVTRKYRNLVNPPADQEIEKFGAFVTGFLYWWAWFYNIPLGGSKAQGIIDKGFPLWISYDLHKATKSKGQLYEMDKWWTMKWSCHKGKINKCVRIRNRMALVGRVIRALSRVSMGHRPRKLDTDKVFKLTQDYNHGLDKARISRATGLQDLILKDKVTFVGKIRYEVVEETGMDQEVCYAE